MHVVGCMYRRAGNFRGRKLLRILRFCKSFLREIWGCGVLFTAQASNRESFLRENRVFHQLAKVFSLKGSRHMYIRYLFYLHTTSRFLVKMLEASHFSLRTLELLL